MTVISIKNNFPEVIAKLKTLEDGIGNKAVVRSLNATIDQGKTQMARTISKEFRISVGTAKDRLSVTRASASSANVGFEVALEATRRGKGRAMNLIAFAETSVTLAQARKRIKGGEGGKHTLRNGGVITKALQVRFQIKRSGGKKMIKGAFIGNKGRTLFIREGKKRLPIKSLSTIDIPSMFNTKRINAEVVKVMRERFAANFDRELAKITEGFIK